MTFLATWLLGRGLPSWLVKLLEPVLMALIAAMILWGIYHEIHAAGERDQKAKDAGEIADIRTNITTLTANVATKDGQIAAANASIDALRKDGDAKAAAALAERDAAVKANKALTDQSRALAASASHPSGKPCAVSGALAKARGL